MSVRHETTATEDPSAKSHRWTVSCACGWTRSRITTAAAAMLAGSYHANQAESAAQLTEVNGRERTGDHNDRVA